MKSWLDLPIGEYLGDYASDYRILLSFHDNDTLGTETINLLLKRAGYETTIECLLNKQFIPVGFSCYGIIVVYVYDNVNQVCFVSDEEYSKFLKRRYPKIDYTDLISRLPPC